eukprot:gnl/TRDRNA2_/TRDRNA2_159059_c0_seq2.p1 gnl/TRDRNA2_/TRDRNA2_159059_c0~~gnl/TRDRNA2_/TRDRNA2_159059_c0_seq2.p1  ORF type:complete len:287 (-),score=53.25 gnl/TRDRNA2_/TRDRNA2_159059_c0_seq2:10-870(-)
MYTLFNVVILSEWPEVGRPLWEAQPYMFIPFFGFIVFTTFGLANVIIGIIVDSTMTAADAVNAHEMSKKALRNLKDLKLIHDMLYSVHHGRQNSHMISRNDFLHLWKKNPNLSQALNDILDLPRLATGEEVFDLLDRRGGEAMTAADFMLDTFRLNDHNEFQGQLQTLISLHRLERTLSRTREEVHALYLYLGPKGSQGTRGAARTPSPAASSTTTARTNSPAAANEEKTNQAAAATTPDLEHVAQVVGDLVEKRMIKVEQRIDSRLDAMKHSTNLSTGHKVEQKI